MRRSRGQSPWWAAGVLALAAACARPPVESTGLDAAKPPRAVRLHAVTLSAQARTVGVAGVLAAQEEVSLGMQVGGSLGTLAVDIGDAVDAGTVLAELDLRDFELERDRAAAVLQAAHARLGVDEGRELTSVDVEATAQVREAEAVLVEATVQRERLLTLVQQQLRPPAELETADATLAVARSRLQRARDEVRTWLAEAAQRRVEVAQANKRLQDARVVAPWRGRVAARHAAPGQVLAPGAPVVTLVRTDPLRLRLPVPERLAGGVAMGQAVSFTVDGRPGERRTGRIVRLGAVVDRNNRTLLVEAEVGNGDGALRPGAFCRADIVVDEAAQVVVVPKTALVTFAGVTRVFTVTAEQGKPARARGVVVAPGREIGDVVEIVRGIDVGDRIVAEAAGLVNGAQVVVAP